MRALTGIVSIATMSLIGPMATVMAADTDHLTASIDGKTFTAEWTEASQFAMAGKSMLNFNGHIGTGIGSRFINCQLAAPKPGSFPIGGGSMLARTSCSYTAGADLMADKYRFKSGSITITRLDAASSDVSGTFSGSAANGAGQPLTIADGSFDIHYTSK
ncbi:MAG: hypothetical protein ABI870_00090 [Rhodanobacter sp.]